ncbi:MAG: hypothetical protein ACE5E5_01695 [Phycisphaerae bacterium]
MSADAREALKIETEFLSGVGANFEAAKGKQLRGSSWERVESDEEDALRAMMASHRNYDKALLRSLPKNRRVELHGFARRLIFWKKKTGVAVATVLCPLDHFASGHSDNAPPIGLGELLDHVRKVATDKKVHYLIGVCSPTGFTNEARDAKLNMPNAQIVLTEPDGHGGYTTTACDDELDASIIRLFDAEDVKQKIERVREAIERRSAELITGGLTVSAVAQNLGLKEDLVARAFEQASQSDTELRLSRKSGEMLLFRGAPVSHQEKSSMNVIDKIKQLFSGEGSEAEKINLLAERRATLAQRRDRIYEDIGKLEIKEAELLAQGKAAKSSVPKRRLAAQLAQMRKDIARQNTTAAMLNKQMDIISTDIHNLTLIQQGQAAQLPDTEELTSHAVEAEEMLETLKADSDLVGSLETGIEESLASDEELAILKEFEEAEAEAAPPQQASDTPAPATAIPSTPTAGERADSSAAASHEPQHQADKEPENEAG